MNAEFKSMGYLVCSESFLRNEQSMVRSRTKGFATRAFLQDPCSCSARNRFRSLLQRWLVQLNKLNDCIRYHYRMSMWQKHCIMVHLESMKNVVEQMQQCIQVWGRLVQICIKKCDDSTLHFVCWKIGFFQRRIKNYQKLQSAVRNNWRWLSKAMQSSQSMPCFTRLQPWHPIPS